MNENRLEKESFLTDSECNMLIKAIQKHKNSPDSLLLPELVALFDKAHKCAMNRTKSYYLEKELRNTFKPLFINK
tara:strand:+ start:354 stop:578 length:225 start_codon:yes stop_codon:yes gene_type:complete